MNTHDHDHDDLPGEDELKALYRSLPRKEPSPALDAAVKRAADAAVRAQPRRRPTRWPMAVASAAVLLVAAGLSWRMVQQPASVPQIPSSPVAASSSTPASPVVEAASEQRSAEIASAPAAPVTSAPAPRMASPIRPKAENIRSAVKPKVLAPAMPVEPAPITAATPIPAQQQDRAANAPMPAPAPPAPQVAVEEARLASDGVRQAVSPTPEPGSSVARYAPSPMAPAATMAGHMQSAATSMKAVMAPAPMPGPDSTAIDAADTPAQELTKIRYLFALHRHDEAVQRLLAFQQAHPDVPVPDDLRAQLPEHE